MKFLEVFVTGNEEETAIEFQTLLNSKISDALEINKVELASNILDESNPLDENESIAEAYKGILSSPSREKKEMRLKAFMKDPKKQKFWTDMGETPPTYSRPRWLETKKAYSARTQKTEEEVEFVDEHSKSKQTKAYIARYAREALGIKAPGVHTSTDTLRHIKSEYGTKAMKGAVRRGNVILKSRVFKKANVETLDDVAKLNKLSFNKEESELTESGPTRKHFRQTADLISKIEDPAKRKEMASHHASIYAQQNPRFKRDVFMKASGVNEGLKADMKAARSGMKSFHTKSDDVEKMQGIQLRVANIAKRLKKKESDLWKNEGVDEAATATAARTLVNPNRNILTNIRRATQVLNLRGINPVMAAGAHRDFSKLVAKNPKAPGYMLLRKLSANKAMAMQNLTQAGVPVGSGLEANPADFSQALQRIKRFK